MFAVAGWVVAGTVAVGAVVVGVGLLMVDSLFKQTSDEPRKR